MHHGVISRPSVLSAIGLDFFSAPACQVHPLICPPLPGRLEICAWNLEGSIQMDFTYVDFTLHGTFPNRSLLNFHLSEEERKGVLGAQMRCSGQVLKNQQCTVTEILGSPSFGLFSFWGLISEILWLLRT
eukprot:3979687-Amphidinium_carterae.1